jgi:monofunctional biosynthetic peptidoglycan transglycosylase
MSEKKSFFGRYFFISFLILILVLLNIFVAYIYPDIQKIQVLKKSYVHHKITEPGKVRYKIQKEKPKYWVDYKDISRHGKWAIIISEDWGFFHHNGFDLNQIQEVLMNYIKEGKLKRGASTITQQLIKNIFLKPEKTIKRKIHELILSVYLEKQLSKNKIAEIYFNIIEFDFNVYGLKKASKKFFNKHPISLTAREGAYLAMVLPNPKRYNTSFEKKQLTKYATERIYVTLDKLKRAKIISSSEYYKAISERLVFEESEPLGERTVNPFDETKK